MMYDEKIEDLAKNKTQERFFNTDANHAKVVLLNLMKYADNYVYIVCCSMCSDVSNNEKYIDAVEEFLKKDNSQLKVLFTNHSQDNFGNTEIAKKLKDYKNKEIRSLKDNNNIQVDGKLINFTVADDRAYRVETDVNERIAFGNFNDADNAIILRNKFNSLFNDTLSERITI